MNGIEEYSNAFSREYCNVVIDTFEKMYQRGQTYFQNSIHKNSDDRVMYDWAPGNTVFYQDTEICKHFYDGIHKVYTEHYSQKYNVLTTLFQHTPKGMGIQRTSPHQGYHAWHTEQGNIASSCRIIAYTLYLNDIDQGGETEFLYQGVKVKPEAGKVLFFPTGFMYPHRGNPIYDGYKYIVTGWYTFDH
jgi:hypothetical protein